MKQNILLFLFISLFLSLNLNAQTNKLSTKNKKAEKAYLKAVEDLTAYSYEAAISGFKKAIELDDKFVEAYIMLGTTYEELKMPFKAIENYKKAIAINEKLWPNIFFITAELELKNGLYAESITHYNKFLDYIDKNDIAMIEKVQNNLDNAKFALELFNNPVPFEPLNVGPKINTEHADYSPTLTADEQILIITISRPRDKYTECASCKEEEDFFISYKKEGEWTQIKSAGPPLNTHQNEGAQCISPDGKTIIYTGCERKMGHGSCDLYTAKYEGGKWSYPRNIGGTVNSEYWESQPSISSDGRTIYFTSGRPGSIGGMDIWYTELNESGRWQKPKNIGDVINTTGQEMSPFIHPDNQTLYFTSTGHKGLGDFDIFISRKDAEGNWGEPINIGYPINTYKRESHVIVNAKGNTAYYASDMEGGYGKLDIYSFELYEEARPITVTYLKGIVFDDETQEKLGAHFELIDLETQEIVIESSSDKTTGEFLVCLPTNSEYALNVSKDGYLFYSDNFKLKGTSSEADPFHKDIPLQAISDSGIVILKNIFFDTDKFDLKKESTVELTKLINLLEKNPSLKIEIRGHTDNQGNKQHNQVLSVNRAKSVYNYLIENGISSTRLAYVGFGMDKPIDTNDTEEGRANNRRTEFRVVSH
jgi:outer membrane protein OmpA-like peptidoglycan-associated protein/tetratricopeptide (TPR) repeat protein